MKLLKNSKERKVTSKPTGSSEPCIVYIHFLYSIYTVYTVLSAVFSQHPASIFSLSLLLCLHKMQFRPMNDLTFPETLIHLGLVTS